jgi:hypothetical protein
MLRERAATSHVLRTLSPRTEVITGGEELVTFVYFVYQHINSSN